MPTRQMENEAYLVGKEAKMTIRNFLFRRRPKDNETMENLLHKIGRIKELEKKYITLEKVARESITDRNRLAIRIQRLEFHEKKRKSKKGEDNGKDKD